MRILAGGLAICVAVGLLSACDTTPGPEALEERPPVLQDFSFSPQRLVYALLPEYQIVGDSVAVPLKISVVAHGPDAPIERVRFVVQSPESPSDPILQGSLDPAGGGVFEAATTFNISALEVRTYTVLVYAVDQAERLSGEARGLLEYVRAFTPGSPPVLEDVIAPDTLRRPAAGQPNASLLMVAQANDPDGRTDVEKVEFWNISAPASRFLMCDDGGARACGGSPNSGDALAGDGKFTLRVLISSTNALGVNTLVFQATDRAGLMSETQTRDIVIVE